MIITTLWLEQRESLTIHVLRKRWREKKRHEVRLGPTDAVEQREEGWNLWRGTRVCPFGCRLPQQQSTFRLADPSFPVTRMAFPLFDVSTPAGTRLRRREERKKNVRESGEAGKGRHCSTMAQLFFVVERGGRKKKKRKFREFAVGIIRRADGATRHRDSGPMFLRHHSIYEYRWKERNLIWPENAFRRWFLVNLVDRIMELDIVEQKWPMYRGWNREWFIGTLYGLYHVIGNGYLSWICFFFFTGTYISFFHIYNFSLLFLFRVFVTFEQIFRNLLCSIQVGYFWIVGDCRKVGINI